MADYPSRVALVTGTSAGIGLALARELLARGWRVVGIARRLAEIEQQSYLHLRLDLEDTAALLEGIERAAGPLVSDAAVTRVALVNNAAMGGLLGPVEQLVVAGLPGIYAVNLTAPVALMGWLLRRSHANAAVRIVNVSTGAAVRAFPGLAAYGSSKAALRMAGMVLAVELDAASPARDVSILSYEPGMVDTDMQTAARGSSRDVLPMVDFFTQAATEGRLEPPARPAAEMADYVDGDGYPRFAERRFEPAPRDASSTS